MNEMKDRLVLKTLQALEDYRFRDGTHPMTAAEYVADALIAAGAILRGSCKWAQEDNDGDIWACDGCSAVWVFTDGNPFDNDMKYCPQCGKKIAAIVHLEWNGEEMVEREEVRTAMEGKK